MSRRKTFSLSVVFASPPLLKGFVLSFSLHVLFLAVFFVLAGENRKDFIPITVLLAGGLPGETGGNDQTASSGPKRSMAKRVKRNPVGLVQRVAEADNALELEKTLFPSDTNRKTAAIEPDSAIGISRSLSREAGLAGGEITVTGQSWSGHAEHGESGCNEGGHSDTGWGSGSDSGPGHGSVGDGSTSYLSTNFSYIRDRIIKELSYPAEARRMGWKGRVTISFIINDNGCVETVKVVESSGHQLLDAHAIKVIKNCQPFPRPPVRAEVVIPIIFKIG